MLPIPIGRHDSNSLEAHLPFEREDGDESSRNPYSSSEETTLAIKRRRVHRLSSGQEDEEKFIDLLRDTPEEIEMSLKERALGIETKKES